MDVALRSDRGANLFDTLDDLHFEKLLTFCRHATRQFMTTFTAFFASNTISDDSS